MPLIITIIYLCLQVGEENLAFNPILDALSAENVLYKTPNSKDSNFAN